MDATVEQIVFQRKVSKKGDMQWTYTDHSIGPIEKYSTTWEGMRLVVEEANKRNWDSSIVPLCNGLTVASIYADTKLLSYVTGQSAPCAVAEAIIEAIRGADKSMP